MKSSLQLALVASSTLLLAACASGGMTRAVPEPNRSAPNAVVENAEYIAYVEELARRRGVDVQWVNPPVRRVANHQASAPTP